MNTALGYFTKAFFYGRDHEFECLLWHVTSLEVLLGDRGMDASRRIGDRIGTICGGRDDAQRYKERFGEIYRLRNSLVHGATSREPMNSDDLLDVYLINRRIFLWFLQFFEATQSEVTKTGDHQNTPGRDDVLALIDAYCRNNRHLVWLLNRYPNGLPFQS